MGSGYEDAAKGALIQPTKAIVPYPGQRNTIDGVRFGYPEIIDDDQFCELLYRVKRWGLTVSWSLSGTIGGLTATEVGSGSGSMILNPAITSERDLVEPVWNLFGAQGSWLADPISYTYTRVIDGDSETVNTTSTGYLWIAASFAAPALTTPVTTYTWRTDLERWVPRVDAIGIGAGFFVCATAQDITPPTDWTPITFTGSFNGAAMEVRGITRDTLSVVSADLVIEPVEWWEYRTAAGADPIYDSATGAKIRSPITQVF